MEPLTVVTVSTNPLVLVMPDQCQQWTGCTGAVTASRLNTDGGDTPVIMVTASRLDTDSGDTPVLMVTASRLDTDSGYTAVLM